MQFAKPQFNTNSSFRGALQSRVKPVQAMRVEPADGQQPHSAMTLQPKPVQVQGQSAPQAAPQAAAPATQAPLIPAAPQAPAPVMAQARDVHSEFNQMANAFTAKPEVVAMGELGKQLQTMDPNSPQAAELKGKLDQAKAAITQSPEYQRLAQAHQSLQQRVSDEQAFQQGYNGQ